jgi:biotin operon repressor
MRIKTLIATILIIAVCAACGGSEDVPAAATDGANVITASGEAAEPGETVPTAAGDQAQSGGEAAADPGNPTGATDPSQSGETAAVTENPAVVNDPHATEPPIIEEDEEILIDDGSGDTTDAAVMPAPFGANPPEAEATRSFYFPFVSKFDGVPGALLMIVPAEDFEIWISDDIVSEEPQTSVNDSKNIYTFISDFGLSDDEVKEALKMFYEMSDPQMLSGDDIDVIVGGSETDINKRFASEYSIVAGGKIYPPHWVYENSAESYKEAGITPEMLNDKIELYRDLGMSETAVAALIKKIEAYKG